MRRLAPVALAVVCAALFVACGGGQTSDPPTAALTVKKTWPREEFKEMVTGKKMQEVLDAVGKPDSTSESGQDVYWYYKSKTVDPLTGKTDSSAQVCFKNGKVSNVNY